MRNNHTDIRNNVTIVPVRHGLFSREWLVVLLVALTAIATWTIVWKVPSQRTEKQQAVYKVEKRVKELEIVFLDVGQGDSIFIRTPNGRTVLVDAGSAKNQYAAFDAGEHAILPFLRTRGINRIDTLVMTHPHADHFGGMQSLLDSIEFGEYLDPGMDHPVPSYFTLLETIQKKGILYREVKAPQILDWDPEMFIQVLWPEKGFRTENPNDISIVLRIVYGDIVYLLAGDVEADVESVLNLYGNQMRTTVLKVPHHGSNTSSSLNFLENIVPRLAVISVGYNNRFDHPKAEILTRYEKMNIPVLRTDRVGTIRTMTDGKVVRVFPELGGPFEIFPFPSEPPMESS
ncbi:MBL fold metallo-hydrolase [bacterium]|nr:MBL fold metallo-hydrolase [candidate division CSSED10-310 bacterium]